MSNLNAAPPAYQLRRGLSAVTGTVTPPDDLQPAIDALSDTGRAWLNRRCKGRDIQPRDVALAADFERGELNHG